MKEMSQNIFRREWNPALQVLLSKTYVSIELDKVRSLTHARDDV